MNEEKKKAIYRLNSNLSIMKFTEIFVLMSAIFCCIIYIVCFYISDNEKTINSAACQVIGFIMIPMATNAVGFLVNSKAKARVNVVYDMYAILPINRAYLIEQDFRYWKFMPVCLAVVLTALNTVYLVRDNLERISGYFVLITVIGIIMVIGDYYARFRRVNGGAIIKTILVILCACIPCIILTNSGEKLYIKFIELDFFKNIAGIPMFILSLALVPYVFLMHNKYAYKEDRKSAAWYI